MADLAPDGAGRGGRAGLPNATEATFVPFPGIASRTHSATLSRHSGTRGDCGGILIIAVAAATLAATAGTAHAGVGLSASASLGGTTTVGSASPGSVTIVPSTTEGQADSTFRVERITLVIEPRTPVDLKSGQVCEIAFNVFTYKMPTVDVSPGKPGVQASAIGAASGSIVAGSGVGLPASGAGTTSVTVNPAPPPPVDPCRRGCTIPSSNG